MPPSESKPRVLILDDKISMAEMLADGLADRYDTSALASSRAAIALFSEQTFDAVVTDLRMPGADGLEVLAELHRVQPRCPVIVMTAYGAIDTAVESIRRGAFHYLTKPFKLDELAIFLERALEQTRIREEATSLKRALRERFAAANIIGQSPAMRAALDLVERVAPTDVPVLLTGETGTGKGVVARAIHAESPRAARPFVPINCAAIPEALLESELFGHKKGAFTGATSTRSGLFAEASGGTIFLDEIGDMPAALQAKLLHILEQGTVRPLGTDREVRLDVRIIAATHRNLRERVESGAFREDLLYRLDVVTIDLPPLRHRPEDIADLVAFFLRQARERHPGAVAERFSRDALLRLTQYRWPGNVRELAHAVERTVLLARSPEIAVADLPSSARDGQAVNASTFGSDVIPVRLLQRRYALWALRKLGGHKGQTAERLGIDQKTLAKWLAEEAEGGDTET